MKTPRTLLQRLFPSQWKIAPIHLDKFVAINSSGSYLRDRGEVIGDVYLAKTFERAIDAENAIIGSIWAYGYALKRHRRYDRARKSHALLNPPRQVPPFTTRTKTP